MALETSGKTESIRANSETDHQRCGFLKGTFARNAPVSASFWEIQIQHHRTVVPRMLDILSTTRVDSGSTSLSMARLLK